MFIYDFKYDDLSRIAFNHFVKFEATKYKIERKFYVINFDDVNRCHRYKGSLCLFDLQKILLFKSLFSWIISGAFT